MVAIFMSVLLAWRSARIEHDATGDVETVYDFKLHEPRHAAASLAIQSGANIKSVQNMLGHESAALTLDRYGHLYPSDVEAVGVAINNLLTAGDYSQVWAKCGHRREKRPRRVVPKPL